MGATIQTYLLGKESCDAASARRAGISHILPACLWQRTLLSRKEDDIYGRTAEASKALPSSIDGVDDAAKCADTVSALGVLGLDRATRRGLFHLSQLPDSEDIVQAEDGEGSCMNLTQRVPTSSPCLSSSMWQRFLNVTRQRLEKMPYNTDCFWQNTRHFACR